VKKNNLLYALFAGVFFKEHQALVVLSLYLIGTIVALMVSFILSADYFFRRKAYVNTYQCITVRSNIWICDLYAL